MRIVIIAVEMVRRRVQQRWAEFQSAWRSMGSGNGKTGGQKGKRRKCEVRTVVCVWVGMGVCVGVMVQSRGIGH